MPPWLNRIHRENPARIPSPDPTPQERTRIELLLARDGEEATRRWVARTIDIYRKALASPHNPASEAYQHRIARSIEEFEAWLSHGALPPPPPSLEERGKSAMP